MQSITDSSIGNSKRITLDEWGDSDVVQLSEKDIEFIQTQINKSDNSRITLIPKGHGIVLEAQNWVGAFSLPSGKIIQIEPKLELNFFKMLAFVLDIQNFEFPQGITSANPGSLLIDLIAKLFIDRYQEIEKMGILRRYTCQEENLGFVRGRILFQEQLRKNIAQDHLMYCSFDELSMDITENRALLFSAIILKNLVQTEDLKKSLVEASITLSAQGISLIGVQPYEIENIVISRLNAYYEPILKLCKFIIQNTWIEDFWEEESVPITSFLMDMNTLFEDFVTKLLIESLSEFDVQAQKSFRNSLVTKPNTLGKLPLTQDLLRNVTIRPDVIISRQSRRQIIVDAKYKREFSDSDIHQAIAYSLALKAPTLLVLPESLIPTFGCYFVTPTPEAKIFVLTINLKLETKTFDEFIIYLKTEIRQKILSIIQETSNC